MIVKDVLGKYELKVDVQRRIVYEKNEGMWTKEEFARLHNDYVTKIVPAFGGKTWAKCCNLVGYKTSDITDDIAEHNLWCEKNGFTHAALIVESAIIKMQMNRSVKGGVFPMAFTDEKEADAWLRSQGF